MEGRPPLPRAGGPAMGTTGDGWSVSGAGTAGPSIGGRRWAMRWEWPGRWTGAACAVAGCMPMLFGLLAGTAGAAGAQAVGSMMGGAVMVPAWVSALGAASWPLLLASAALLVWSFWRTRFPARAVAYAGVAVLIANQTHMTPWLFFPGLALIVLGFTLAYTGTRPAAARASRAVP